MCCGLDHRAFLVELNFQTIDLELALPWATSRTAQPGGIRTSKVVHVCLSDENGVEGFGEAAPIRRYDETAESVAHFLRSFPVQDLSLNSIADSVALIAGTGSGQMAARCALESALLDLAGKRSRRPVWELLQIERPEPKPVSYTIGIGSVDHVREQVRRAANFRILKLKLGGPDDRAALQALRSLASDKIVRVDANEGWSGREQALRMIEWLAEDPRIEFVEQPLSAKLPDDDHRWLFERSPLPLMADESCHRTADVSRLAGSFHGVNVKLMKTGGLTEGVQCLQTARRLGLKTMLGCMIESTLGIAAAFQLAGLADYLDLDSHVLLARDPFAGLELNGGILSLSGEELRPGLGVPPKRGQVKPSSRR